MTFFNPGAWCSVLTTSGRSEWVLPDSEIHRHVPRSLRCGRVTVIRDNVRGNAQGGKLSATGLFTTEAI
jgi:hypothetical protein